MKVKGKNNMINTRDDYCEIDYEKIYNPYMINKIVENIKTKIVAKIIYLDDYHAVLEFNIDKNLYSKEYLDISIKELKNEWVKCNKIIIGKLSSEEERIHIELNFEDIGFVVNNEWHIVAKSKVKKGKKL